MKIFFKMLFTFFVFTPLMLAYTGEVVKAFDAPGEFPTGLCFDGKNLWLADRGSDKLYCLNSETGQILREIESPAYWPMGLAWDGEYLWNSDFRGRTDKSEDLDGMVFKIDPKDGTILKTLQSPAKSSIGLTWDGEYLWCVDDKKDMVIQFHPNDGSTIRSFPSPSGEPKGIAYDGKYLWISDRETDELYMVDPKTGYVIIITDAPGKYPHGLAVGDNKLWVADQDSKQIFQLKIRDHEKFVQKDKETHKVTFNHNTTCFGPGKIKILEVNVALPDNRDSQKILQEFRYNVQPKEIKSDRWGQKTACFEFHDIQPGEKKEIKVTSLIETCNLRYFIYPENVGALQEIPKDIAKNYLIDDVKYQINSDIIQKVVKKVVGDEKNPYWIMRRLHQYLIGHLQYIMDGYWDTAPTVIANGHGSCSEYTFVYISLCRAAGLPARYVGSVWNRRDEVYMDDVYHRWVEVYLPNYGWVPTDPTHGDRESPRDQAFPIGLVRNKALITTQSGGGSETLEWTYNSNENYVTEPKTNLNTTHYADWGKTDQK
ncbi:MAG: transglutaminase [Candidatus Marinimicrobia bacterium]|nr:transglutaminase [Candidatus Neomarinimicrobiota bacterium]